ncbi:sugar porter family MFS transporter [Tanticharoenia sakaeratensis]|jgi:MFS transporter, SP family, major inositol transporter|uniref:Sugar-proton symporter n=1 Tax=Tanticharoenia sakaeratensis NBRC 103193 TaxID=1231623 RepID=A0A0D6MPW4_9PROT|nr:sugar porter family MFS transporter [Tanticharoenia sakaeratensis]GAN55430.1 sugar-proton symporter [Tanticharoenia sakaeratensis NBRC 103193]GBQ22086.1 major facilitator superfamily sugar transporter [Tanticharoenia sakaeratensis NBRC 103193]
MYVAQQTSETSGPKPHSPMLTNVIAAVAATGGLLFGYDTGIISAALLQLTRDFHLSTMSAQVVTSAIILGALFGCLGAAPISDRAGRRRTVMVAAALFLLGTAMVASAHAVWMLIVSRLVLGLAIGAASQIVPVYIAEVSPPHRRGQLVVGFQLAVVLGVTISFITGYLLRHDSWRWMFGMGMLPALILFMGMIFLPNSPRWLAMRGDMEGARAVLVRLRGSQEAADKELADIEAAHDVRAPWSEVLSDWVRPALVASVGIALLCQLTGINAVLYYAPTIFAGAGIGEQSALLTSIAIGVAMTVATMFGGWAVDAWGRRALLLRLLPGAVISLIVLGAAFVFGANGGIGIWIKVVAIVAYTVFNTGSLSVAIWLVGAEVYPLSCRGKGTSLVAASHWGADFVISLTTLSLVQMLGAGGTFLLFAAVNAFAFFFVLRYVPETRGHSLEELEARLRNGTFAPVDRQHAPQHAAATLTHG